MEEEANAANVQVTVRCRPMNRTEIAAGNTSVFAQESDKVVLTHPTDGTKYEFVFDHMFGEDSAQEAVYTQSAAPILDKAFAGFNGTIFAYGQTGSGKTHCMMGSGTAPEMQGIIPRMKFALFERIQREVADNPTRQYLVECSYFEVYNEIIYDLLDASRKAPDGRGAAAAHAGQGLEIKEDKVRGIYVKGLKEVVVSDPESLDALMVQGNGMRTQAATNMNERSSRSHSIFTIQIRQRDLADAGHNLFAKINLVDLAGSERADKTGATGDRLKEGSNINKSLSELGNVINKLAEYGKAQGANKKKVFIPYRNSKLTRVLQESLGGNSLTVMIATFSPAASNFNESLTTLRYADRAKAIPVNATKNDESEAIEKLNKEIAALRKRLEAQAGGGGVSSAEARIMEERYRQQIQEIEGSMKQTWEEKTKLSAQYESERIRLLEEGKKETERLRSQFENERKRRWRLLEEKGDLEQVVKELYGWDEGALPMSNAGAGSSTTTAGARKGIILFSETPVLTGGESVSQPTTSTVPLPPGVDMHQWVLKYRSSIGLMQVAREHSTMATVYRDSVVADISRAQASKIELSTESLTTAKSIMEQTDAKLTMMRSEFDCVVAKRDASMAELAVLKEMAKSSLTTVLAPRRLPPKSAEGVGDEAVGQGQGGMLTPVAPESPAPLNPRPGRPVRAKGIQLLSEPDEETGGTTVQESEAAGSSVDAPPPVVVEDMPVSEEAIQSQKLEVEALELLLRVIERQGSTLLLQGEEALRGYDLSAALPHLAALLQLELSRALPSSGVDIPSDATDASLSTILGQVTQLLPTPVPAGKKKPLPLKPPADPSSLTESVSSALVRLRARYSCQLASLAAAVQAQRASEASRLAGLEDTVSALKLRVAALEGSLATCEANLSKERSAGATLRQRLASINTELEVAKASHHSTAENASAATAQVTDLSRKLGEASEELVKTNLALTEALAELKDTSAKYTLLQTESAARIDTLNARVRKAEASAEEESNQNAALVAKLSTVENQVLELQTALVRVQAENDTAQERDKSSHSELLLLQSAVSEAKQDRDSQRDALAAALAEVQEMKERLIVAEEERDAARDKEEEYFRELEEREEQISRIQEGYVDISDRLNDKMDEVMEYQSEIEHWKSLSMSWQQKAMQAAAVTPRGSAMDAVPVRRAEMAARGTLCRMYTALQQLDADLRKAKAKPPKKRGDDEDEYDDDFDDDGAPDPQKPTLQTIPTPNFEDMDLAELSTALLACMTAVANNANAGR